MSDKPVTRRFLIHLAFFMLRALAYAIDPQHARQNEENWKKEIWVLEGL